jgi:hypothetical protein
MNQLKELVDQYTDKAAEAAVIPEETDPRVRAGVEALVRNAKQELPLIQRKYSEAVMSNIVLIAVSGANSEKFAQEAEKLGAVSVDFLSVYKKIAERLAQRAVGPTYTTDAHFKLLDELSKIRLEYDVVRLPNPMINAYSDGIYDAPINDALLALFEKNYGSSLYSAAARRDIGKEAFEKKFTGKLLPVILYNYNGAIDAQMLPAPAATFVADKAVTSKQVSKLLTQVKNTLNGKTSKEDADETEETQEAQENQETLNQTVTQE